MSIAKTGKNKASSGAVNYVFKSDEGAEKQPEVIGGNVTGASKKEIKAEFHEQEKLNKKAKNTVTHISISFPPEKEISNEDAADYADALVEKLGYEKNPYLVVRHYDKDKRDDKPFAHVHIVASRINNDGTLISEWEIAERVIETAKETDKKFNLESVDYIRLSAEEKQERNIKKNEYQMMSRTNKLSVLEEFKDCAETSLSSKKDVQEFVKDVQLGGFEVLPNVSDTTGRMNGFSFSKDGIVFTASRAGRKFKWANLSEEVNYQLERDTAFLQTLKAEVLAKKESKKQPEKITNVIKKVTKITEVVENEATGKRETNRQSNENGNQSEEKSDAQTKIAAVEKSPRIKSDAHLAETQVNGAKSSQIRDDRTDDQTARSRQKVAGNNQENFITIKPSEKENTDTHAKSERPTDRRDEGRDESQGEHRRIATETESSSTSNNREGAGTEKGDEQISELSSVVGEYQSADGEGIEHSENVGSRLSDRSQLAAEKRNRISAESSINNAKSDKFDSAKNSGSERVGNLKGEGNSEKSRVGEITAGLFNRAADFGDAHNSVLFLDEQGFERELSGTEKSIGGIDKTTRSRASRESDNSAEFQRDDYHAQTDISGGREFLQFTAGGKSESYSRDPEASRRAAEKTAQVINIKRFSGCLDSQIVTAWTAIIEKSNAAEFLNEIVKSKNQAEQQKVYEHLDKQAEIIAQNLRLPKPEPQQEIDPDKLAAALTRIEVANFEEVTGEQVGEKTFELLVERSALRAFQPPTSEQLDSIQETFDDSPVNLSFSSNLEAETLNALLNPQMIGFDEEVITRTQENVETNEAAARETATLVQIAFGGQGDKFTEDFKLDLAEQIYYSPTPAIDVYQDFRQLDWQRTAEIFAPVMKNIAEQYQMIINPPGNDGERNKMLADFVAQDLIRAYENQNNLMEKYVQNGITESAMKASGLGVDQTQKNTIAGSIDKNLEPPEFSNRLEASAYNLTKYDDDKKAELAVEAADQIREETKIEAEIQMQAEMQEAQVLTMN
jgi:hypothetical protein